MSYCTKCGAYIPDGQTSCLACGFDEAAEKSSGSAAARKQKSGTGFSNMNSEELRRELEYQRKKKQENLNGMYHKKGCRKTASILKDS